MEGAAVTKSSPAPPFSLHGSIHGTSCHRLPQLQSTHAPLLCSRPMKRSKAQAHAYIQIIYPCHMRQYIVPYIQCIYRHTNYHHYVHWHAETTELDRERCINQSPERHLRQRRWSCCCLLPRPRASRCSARCRSWIDAGGGGPTPGAQLYPAVAAVIKYSIASLSLY